MSFPAPWIGRISRARIIAMAVLESAGQAEPLAAVLHKAGITAVEWTLRSASALDGLRPVKLAFPGMIVGAGNVLNEQQLHAVQGAGADFATSPVLNPAVVLAAQKAGLPFAPGVCTPTEIDQAVQLGCRLLNYFPAEMSGGPAHLAAIASPHHLSGVRFITVGGLHAGNAGAYLASPWVAALGADWLVPDSALRSGDWETIRSLAGEASALASAIPS